MIDFNCFLTTTISPVSNSLIRFPLLHSSLCISLLSDNRMLNSSLCLNIIGYVASEQPNYCCPSEVPSIELAVDKSFGNGNYMPIVTTDRAMSVPSKRPAFQAYNAKNNPVKHWQRLTLSYHFIFYTWFKYL